MVVTEVWLEVKNGRAVVVDAETARKAGKRHGKKRKVANQSQSKKGNKASKKRKLETVDTEANADAHGGNVSDDDERVDHANMQLFADAQQQLQLEMAAAGFDGDALPLSFGSTGSSSNSQKRKRQRNQSSHMTQAEYQAKASRRAQPVAVVKAVEAPTPPVALEKVHVKYDSDGEVADRHVQTVEIPACANSEEDAVKQQDSEEVTEATAEAPVVQEADTTQVGEDSAPAPDVDPAVFKFWKQRRTLFHKYDEGIQLDRESWYSVTPESIADHIAKRCACDVIVDPFSGCGGNIIQFAKTCKRVIAIEIDDDKIRMAKANAAIYGVADRIEWIHGDATQVLPTLQADVVFLSPPWGGMDYNRNRFAIEEMMVGETSGVGLFEMARRVARNVVYYLPKTTPEADLQALTPEEPVECEHIHLNGQLKVVNAYYGDIAFAPQDEGDVESEADTAGEEAQVQDDAHGDANDEDSTTKDASISFTSHI